MWFLTVERIASERIGRATVTYVAHIYKYFIAYRLVVHEIEQRRMARPADRLSAISDRLSVGRYVKTES